MAPARELMHGGTTRPTWRTYSLTRRALWDFYDRGMRLPGQGAADPEAIRRFRSLWEQDMRQFATNEFNMLTATVDALASGDPAEIDRVRQHFEPHVCGLAILAQSRPYALPSFSLRILRKTTCGPKP